MATHRFAFSACSIMDANRFEQVARELTQLLDQQMEALLAQKSRRFTTKEKTAYEARKRKILSLRAELDEFRSSR